jgi:hypothetical protein
MTWSATRNPRAQCQNGGLSGRALMRITLNGFFIED